MYDIIMAVAKRAVVDQGEKAEDITEVRVGFPKLTSAVTATFYVVVTIGEDSAFYEIPVATRVTYSHPVAVEI